MNESRHTWRACHGIRGCESWHTFTYASVWHDSITITYSHMHLCDMTQSLSHIHICVMAHSRVCHDSFSFVSWLMPMCDMTHSYVEHDSHTRVTWLIHMCNITRSHVHHDSHPRMTWHGRLRDMSCHDTRERGKKNSSLDFLCRFFLFCLSRVVTWHVRRYDTFVCTTQEFQRRHSRVWCACASTTIRRMSHGQGMWHWWRRDTPDTCVAVCCSVCCSVLQCVAVCCSVLQCVALCVAVCCSVLQCVALCVAVCCSVLQCVAVCNT
jgi:hypothetical protein